MKTVLSLVVCAVALSGCAGPRLAPIAAERFEQHIAYLADDALGGRGTGSAGLSAAAEYVAAQFESAGLEPAGDGDGWFQHFEANGGRVLIDGNELVIGGRSLTVEDDWMPFSSVPACDMSGVLVFAGYGISDPDGEGYDDYADVDVKDKVVLVMRGGPGDAQSYYNGGAGQEHVEFAHKINAAYKQGAAGILIANDPLGHPPGSARDVPVPYHGSSAEGVASSLPAAHMTAAAVASTVSAMGFDFSLARRQRRINESGRPASVDMSGVKIRLIIASEREQLDTMNVVGVLPGSDPELAGEWVLVGAHMDHLGLGQGSSMGGAEALGEIHNGADDNASGTSGVIEIAHVLGRREGGLPRTVVFAAFGAEEMGLLGSIWLNEHPPWPADALVAMVNMDMIGRAEDGQVDVGGIGTADVFPELFADLLSAFAGRIALAEDNDDRAQLQLSTGLGVSSNSDHYTFVASEVPAFTLFTGLHDDYHKPSDDTALIDSESGALIATLAAEFVLAVSELDQRPLFQDPDENRPAPVATVSAPEGSTVVRGRVRFGLRADYAYAQDDGILVEGATADSPAEQCGLAHDDLIVAIDGTTIRNMQDYMVLLYSHVPGDEMVLTVQRGDERLELTAVLEAGQGAGR